MKKNLFRVFLYCFFLCLLSEGHAASFQVLELGASVMGSANSGTSVSDDASVQFYNPAGMTNVARHQLSLNGSYIDPAMKFKPKVMTRGGVDNLAASTTDSPASPIEVPAIYYIKPLNQNWFLGFSTTIPYGLDSKYDDDSAARFFATYSSIKAVNLNPSIAYRLNQEWSIGVGANAQHLSANIDSMFAAGASDVSVTNEASDWGYGWNAGIQYRPLEALRLGVSYRSQVTHNLRGKTKVKGSAAQLAILSALGVEAGNAEVNTTLPEFAIFSAQYDVTPTWSLLGDVQYTRWSRIKDLSVLIGAQQRMKTITTKYYNTYRLAIGTLYRVTPAMGLRFGLARDESPVSSRYREARLPDNDRTWVTGGASYAFDKNWLAHFAYAYVHFRDSSLDETDALLNHRIAAEYKGHANLFSMQLTYMFT